MIIFKSGNKQIVKNYRPISFLPTLSTILEKLIKTRLMNFFGKYQVVYKFQYGFWHCSQSFSKALV